MLKERHSYFIVSDGGRFPSSYYNHAASKQLSVLMWTSPCNRISCRTVHGCSWAKSAVGIPLY